MPISKGWPDTMSEFVTNEHIKLSYTAKPPFTATDGSSCSSNNLNDRVVLLVGPNHWTRPLATALLQVQYDRHAMETPFTTAAAPTMTMNYNKDDPNCNHNNNDTSDPAVEALRRHCCHDPPKRRIHTVESLSSYLLEHNNMDWNFRMHHIVLLSPASTKTIVPKDHIEPPPSIDKDNMIHTTATTTTCNESIDRLLHQDYTLYQRVTNVQVHDIGDPQSQSHGKTTTGRKDGILVPDEETNRMSRLIPTLHLYLESPTSLAIVARMLWQRTKVGTREGTPVLPHVSPLIFGP